MSELLIVGKFVGFYGVHGALKVFSYTSPIDNILNYRPWYVVRDGTTETIWLTQKQAHHKSVIVQLQDITTREMANSFLNLEIWIKREQLPKIISGDHYCIDLIGMTVINREGSLLGIVIDIMETGANDVLIVEANDQQVLIPYVKGVYIDTINTVKQQITVDWQIEYLC